MMQKLRIIRDHLLAEESVQQRKVQQAQADWRIDKRNHERVLAEEMQLVALRHDRELTERILSDRGVKL